VQWPLLQAFPSASTLGEMVLHPPSLASLFIYRLLGKCLFPIVQWNPPHDIITSFPTPRLLVGGCHSCLLRLACLFIVLWGISPSPLCGVLFIIHFFSLFSLGGGQSVQGAMLIWSKVVCGSTSCLLAQLVVCFSLASRSWHLVVLEPSWFLHLPWSGDAMSGLVGWGCVWVLPLLDGFSCKVYLQHLSKILL
jgi:hypothetical protein